MPGVQNPHCSPWHSANPCCTGSSRPPRARSSTVRTRRPSAMAASTVHDFTGVSSSHTTHAPQLEVSHPQCDPVSPRSSRRKWMSSSRASTSLVWLTPFTVIVICISTVLSPRPAVRGAGRLPAARGAARPGGRAGGPGAATGW